MLIATFKALHIIGFVTWFAGLFYLGRILVYHAEAFNLPQPDRSVLQKQYQLMEWRVYKIICNPAMMFTWTFGIAMLIVNPAYLQEGWLHIKLTLLLILTGYHLYNKRLIRTFEQGKLARTSFQLRLFNELPTLFLVTIVFLASLGRVKFFVNPLHYLYLLAGILAFGLLIFLGARAYKKRREQQHS